MIDIIDIIITGKINGFIILGSGFLVQDLQQPKICVKLNVSLSEKLIFHLNLVAI